MRAVTALLVLALLSLADGRAAVAATPQQIAAGWGVRRAIMNPRGDLIALMIRERGRTVPRIEIHDVQTGTRRRVLNIADGPRIVVHGLRWADDEHLILTTGTRGLNLFVNSSAKVTDTLVSRIRRAPDGLEVSEGRFPVEGTVVDPLPLQAGVVLFTPYSELGKAYRVSIAGLKLAIDKSRDAARLLAEAELAAEVPGEALQWLVDPKGDVRGCVMVNERGMQVLYRKPGRKSWTVLYRNRGRELPEWLPLGFGSDGTSLLAVKGDPDERDVLYRLDPEAGRARVAFSSPTARILGVAHGTAGEIIGVNTQDRGALRTHYFAWEGERRLSALAGELQRHLFVVGATADRKTLLILAEAAHDPGVFYHRVGDAAPTRVAVVAPALNRDELARVQELHVKGRGAEPVQAFLALPHGHTEPPPLVVLPHGGPIGVANTHHYSTETQFVAAHGFAVLQVNYRGSSGYGRAFQDAGKRQWGRGIEDDIDAAVDAAIAGGKVDGTRVCIAGASYGGYSALISVVRHPTKYRCASALAAPTDLPLLFSTTDSARSEEGRKRWVEIVGDPDKEYQRMIEVSPVYQAASIQVPVQLVHGMADTRVDPEHAIRMKLVMEVLDKELDWIPLKHVGHGGWVEAVEAQFQGARVRFLKRHLRKRPGS